MSRKLHPPVIEVGGEDCYFTLYNLRLESTSGDLYD